MANTYATFTNNTVPSTSKFTWSAWVKRAKLGTQQALFSGAQSSTTGQMIYFNGGADQLGFYGIASSTVRVDKYTTMKFRDVNAWYHIVVAYDSTLSTASDRVKFYVNGELQQLNGTDVQVQGWEPYYMLTYPTDIGRDAMGTSSYFDGEMSHMNFVIGTVYDASAFGSTDSTTGEWKINTSPSVTYSSDGFFILKDGNSVTDQSPNTNNFTVAGGTLTNTEDNPSNVFCVLNKLNSYQPTGTINIQYGNTGFEDGENGSNYSYASGTLGANSGKFYWETKVVDLAEIDQVGVALASSNFMGAANSDGLQSTTYGGKGCQFSNGNKVGDGAQSAYMGGFSANDIMMIALDLDSNKITFGRNGQWADGSGNANQTYANSTPAYTNLTAGEFYFPAQAKRASGSNYGTNWYNFGNGYFQTTAVSNAGTNASNNGIFEYDVPTGFTALSTKGLNL